MSRPLLLVLAYCSLLHFYAEAQDFQPPERMAPAVMKAWEAGGKKVKKNRETYDAANAKVLRDFQKEIEKSKPPVDVEEAVKQFQQAIVKLDEGARPPVPPLPPGVVVFRGHGYKLFEETLSWKDAKARCEAAGGHLLVIDDRDEQSFISQQLKAFTENNKLLNKTATVWMGITHDKEKKMWKTHTGQAQVYTNWEPTHPKQHAEVAKVMCLHGHWFSCDTGERPDNFFICEWDEQP